MFFHFYKYIMIGKSYFKFSAKCSLIVAICAVITSAVFIMLYNGYIFSQVYSTSSPPSLDVGLTNESSHVAKVKDAITIRCNKGRLGNQMCSYAALVGLADLNNRAISVLPCNYNTLNQFFNINASIVDLQAFKEKNPWSIGTFLRPQDQAIDKAANIIKGYPYPCSYTFFNHIRKTIKQEFGFKSHINSYAQNVLSKLKAGRQNITFIGIHVRRTDYVTNVRNAWLKSYGGREVDLEFFQKATAYYRDRYKDILFIAVSDDRPWCEKNLVNLGVHIAENVPSPAHDMAILAHCNHTIMTYGTFGFWGSYLAGGEVVYFDKFLKSDSHFKKYFFQFNKMYLPEWVGISTTSSFKYENTEDARRR